eukprot:TRINITY_DN34961_c0_g1_i1.p1 TRINITY_DN34961_c0_g1~~TRINITY_DN34961_c0_g1_i1.p1  ORF type:complete len:388 (+),score=97.01 TRINITY_DN34961_c0_g1_i1:98-1261(+)
MAGAQRSSFFMLCPNPAAAPAAYAATWRAHAARRPASAPAGGRRPESAAAQAALLETRVAAMAAQREVQQYQDDLDSEEQDHADVQILLEEELQHQESHMDAADEFQEQELQQQLEQLQKQQELEQKLLKLRQQQEQILQQQRDVNRQIHRMQHPHPQRQQLRKPPLQSRQRRPPEAKHSMGDLRIDGKCLTGAGAGNGLNRTASASSVNRKPSSSTGYPKTAAPDASPQKSSNSTAGSRQRPASAGSLRHPVTASDLQRPASASALHRPASAGSQRCPAQMQRPATAGGNSYSSYAGGHQSLRDVHYESMRRQAEQRNERLRERELAREPWTAAPEEGSRPQPRRPWSAVSGYTGYRPLKDVEDCMVGCNLARAGMEARRILLAAA